MMNVGIKTYGCTLNQADSEVIRSVLESNGVIASDGIARAGIAIINTCTVKKGTERKILHRLAEMEAQKKKTIVTGCMAGANRDLIERFAPSASIVTTRNIPNIVEAVSAARNGRRIVLDGTESADRLELLEPGNGVIAKIPLNDGCLSSCSFCETKLARGPLRSFPGALVLKAIGRSIENGSKEIQLTSQDMGAYGRDKGTRIGEFLIDVASMEGDFSARIGMMNPQHLEGNMDGIITALNSGKFYKFLHLPIESGSDSILRSMKRSYTIDRFAELVDELRMKVKGLAVETDIIVGFPGESEEDFTLSADAVRRFGFEVTNISRFGARPHAEASKMKQIGSATINRRSNELSRLVRTVQREINERYIGSAVETLFTEQTKISLNGRTESYRQVILKGAAMPGLLGKRRSMRIEEVTANAIYGRLAG